MYREATFRHLQKKISSRMADGGFETSLCIVRALSLREAIFCVDAPKVMPLLLIDGRQDNRPTLLDSRLLS